ncbi:APC family permease [Mesorhizobium sp. dw_380]|uniref:APC family permease n=1 Tax=Mesorhizobium sp. dw_380 TaxID=2812001 RepID=UPI001BDE165C|nr:APC family permease [Mesorhizobium sp. dw_380]
MNSTVDFIESDNNGQRNEGSSTNNPILDRRRHRDCRGILCRCRVPLGVLGSAELGRDDVPLFKAAKRAIGSWGGRVILAAAWLASLDELISDLLSASRVGLAMGEAHEMPRWLGELHPSFNVPRHAVLAIGAVTFVLVLFFDLRQILPLASLYLLV